MNQEEDSLNPTSSEEKQYIQEPQLKEPTEEEPKIEEVAEQKSEQVCSVKVREDLSEEDFSNFLANEFQNEIEESLKLSDKVSEDESQPFIYKYISREFLKKLLLSKFLDPQYQEGRQSHLLKCARAIAEYKLGVNFFDCEEYFDAEGLLLKALQSLESTSEFYQQNFINVIQDLYNHIGINHCNRGSHEKGVPYLEKAAEIYKTYASQEEIKELNLDSICQFDQDLFKAVAQIRDQNNKGKDEAKKLYIEGGFLKERLEKTYTLTLFYLAQLYTKLDDIEKAVQYCADTMKRQMQFKQYEVKDWAVNCINIAEYFVKNANYAQAEYCLLSGFAILPQDLKKKRKLRATLQMQLGRYYLERLMFGIGSLKEDRDLIPEIVHKKFVEFPELNVKFPQITDFKDLEDAKLLFKLGNTQLKKSLEYFVIDGYVTEHIQMKQDLSKLYKYLAALDPESSRVFAMHDRRRELLEEIVQDINPKAYETTLVELEVELSDIISSMFDIRYEEFLASPKPKKKSQYEEMNQLGLKSIYYSQQAQEKILNKEEKFEYAQAILNITLSVARIYSKIYDKKKLVQISYLEKSLRVYEQLQKFMQSYMAEKKYEQVKDLPPGMSEPYRMMLEMIELLPLKISKLNAAIHKK